MTILNEGKDIITQIPRFKKVLLCFWWGWKGIIYYELLEPGVIKIK